MYNLHIPHDSMTISWLGKLLKIVPLVTVLIGCATDATKIPDYYATDYDSHVPEIKRVALVTDLTPPKIEVDLGFTRWEGASQSAAEGAFKGAGYSLVAGPAYFIVLPFFVAAGAIGGTVSGAASGYSAEMLAKAEADAQYMIDSAYLQNKLLRRVQDYGNDYADLEFIRIPSADQEALLDKPDYTALTDESIDAVIEVELLRLALKIPSGSTSTNLIRLIIDARIRLISTRTGTVLSDNQYQFASSYYKLEAWITNDVVMLSNEIKRGLQRLAEDAIDENFLLFYPNEPEKVPMSSWGMGTPHYVLRRVYSDGPEPVPSYWVVDTESVQPMLRWERFPRDYDLIGADGLLHDITDVSYELRVLKPEGIKQVYYVRDITEPYHKIDSNLDTCSRYIWTVRARFKLDGRTRVIEWAGSYTGYGGYRKPWNMRRGVYIENKPERYYYGFETPCNSDKDIESGNSTPAYDDF